MTKNKIEKIIKIIAVIIIVALAGLIFLTLAPESGGYKALVVTSGSMEPALPVGSLVLVKKSDSLIAGDIITFRLGDDPKNLVTHRIVEILEINDQTMYRTKGDAVIEPDIELVVSSRVVGKVSGRIPVIGYPVVFAKTQMGVLILIVIPAVIIVYEEFKSIWKEIKKIRARHKRSKTK